MNKVVLQENNKVILSRCLVVLDELFYKSSQGISSESTWWRFAEEFASNCRGLTLYVPIGDSSCPVDAKPVVLNNAKLEDRFFFRRTEELYRKYLFYRTEFLRKSKKLICEHDVILLRLPSPLGLKLCKLAWKLNKPTILLVAGDVVNATAYAKASGLKARLARWVAQYMRYQELQMAKRSSFIAVWGQDLFPIFAPINSQVALAADPNISKKAISYRFDTMKDDSIRIVRIGRILPVKGMEYLLYALAELRRRGRNVHLDILGGYDERDYFEKILEMVRQLKIEYYVTFHGQVEFGPDLFEILCHADVHVISSISEGVPRCVAEGRAFGLPTISTNVGGLPTVIQHEVNGLLVDPQKPDQIADAVDRLIQDGNLRRQIIKEGFDLAEKETSEYQARRLAKLIFKALNGESIKRWSTNLKDMP